MAKKKLYKSKSNFTLRRLHQSGSYGNIYERDYLTIVNSLENPGGQIPIYNSPSFKLTVHGGLNFQKKYKLGNWCYNPERCNDGESGIAWTLSCMPDITETPKIKLKPHSRRLTDFACYGSSSELIRCTISNIVKNFPAEIHVGDRTLGQTGILDSDESIRNTMEPYDDWYIVDNPLYIDLIQSTIPENTQVNQLRYFSQAFKKYHAISESGFELIGTNDMSWELESPGTTSTDKNCLKNGELIASITIGINAYKRNLCCFHYMGNLIYLSEQANYSIRPIQSEIDNFFNNLSDFERILLDPQTNYKSIFETYIETEEDGWIMKEKTYQWPLDNGNWNIAIKGLKYSNFINSLTSLSVGYDSMYTDAIWRTMTHEAIANMDLTITNKNDDDTTIGKSKMKKTLTVVGRQFDEIKKYIDNIKNINSITYQQNNNTPDYFLSDNLEMSGWEVKNILTNFNPNDTTPLLYESMVQGFTAEEANNEFMRRLKLNTKQIFKEKGTKRAIEDLLAVFGFHSYDWLKNYHTWIIQKPIEPDDLRKSYLLIEYVYVANGYSKGKTPTETINEVRRINQLKDNYEIGNINDVDSHINIYSGLPVAEAMVNGEVRLVPWINKDNKYDSEMYFQMKGGWARNDGEKDTNGITETPIYGHTVSKIHYIKTLSDLYSLNTSSIDAGGIYYINDNNTYFKLKDISKHTVPLGWKELSEEEVSVYQNIIDNNKGNNPHTGSYDDGYSYLDGFNRLFYNSKFDNARNETIENILDYGFNVERQPDSRKCLFFGDLNVRDEIGVLRKKYLIKPYNFFTGDKGDYKEEASLSIINSKEFDIVFDMKHRDFIENDIIPYLKQIIPSTAIFSYRFGDLTDDTEKIYQAKTHNVVCDGNICPIYGII
jgi:hypothetical protein